MQTHKSFLELVNIPTIPVRLHVPERLNFPANTSAPMQSGMSVFNAMPTLDAIGVLRERSAEIAHLVGNIEFNIGKNNAKQLRNVIGETVEIAEDLKTQCQQILTVLDDGNAAPPPPPVS